MPGTLKFTPKWLSRPSPGFDVFSSQAPAKLTTDTKQKDKKYIGPQRTIARRGTEVFVATGNEIRWSDLVLLKEQWEDAQTKKNGHGNGSEHNEHAGDVDDDDEIGMDEGQDAKPVPSHRILKVPISRAIQQLIISPEGDYLAITTSHTVHVAILPDSSHLNADDTTPLKLKTFHVGPTTHVLERSPIASVLWHPLSPKGGCLVTVTVDAIARVWELDKDNRWSYDSPALDVDLRKLVNGLSSSEDFSPAKYGANKGFSPDSFEMEVASACFGGSTREGEDPWAAMTLWIAMREGDVYALCPLLPSKWSAPPALVTSLTSTIACITSSETDSSHSQRTRVQLRTWLSDIASQEVVITSESLVSDLQHLHRPLRPGAIPKLQGPFTISPDMDEMYDVTDIFAIPAIENEEVNPSEDGEIADELEPSSASLLCLVTSDAKLHVLAAMATVEGRWLPARKPSQPDHDDDDEEIEFLLIESIALGESAEDVFPSFTADPRVQHSVFVTHSTGVSYVDFSSWCSKLAEELNAEDDAGVAFRIDMLLDSVSTSVERPITFSATSPSPPTISTCTALTDSDLGFFVLTTCDNQPYGATLSEPLSHFASTLRIDAPESALLLEYNPDPDLDEATIPDSRPPYQPSTSLYASSSLPTFLDTHAHPRIRRALSSELRLSPAVLHLMLEAHRVLSSETHKLGLAVSDIFRRCERLQDEFREQIRRVRECRDRIDSVMDMDDDSAEQGSNVDGGAKEAIETRLDKARERQEALSERYAELRRKLSRANGRPISEKEDQWIIEVKTMEKLAGVVIEDVNNNDDDEQEEPRVRGTENDDLRTDTPHARFKQVQHLQRRLAEQARQLSQEASTEEQEDMSASFRSSTTSRAGGVSGGSARGGAGNKRRAAQAQEEIEMLLERQTALLEATRGKVGRLAGLGYAAA